MKRTYTCTDFQGHYPVGAAAIVKAENPFQAAEFLNAELRAAGLPGDAKPEKMLPFPRTDEAVRILVDGNY